MMRRDLITEPLLSWRDHRRERHAATLPQLLARLASGELGDFPSVRPHQLDAWTMFLTQLAAVALRRAGATDPRISADEWSRLLLLLTDGAAEPWSLVVSDLSKPAFMQPAVPELDTSGWKRYEHPDDLDILVTSKAHDVKAGLVAAGEVELWVIALVTLQTMQGYPGRGYNRSARMKGGYGSRVRVGLSPDLSLSARFVRDVGTILEGWTAQLARGYSERGVALTWLIGWDGTTSLTMADLSPQFIEVCWRVRMLEHGGGLAAAYTTTTVRRCLPEVENGDTGDPWIPVELKDGGALTVGQRGFHYELMVRVLLGAEFSPAPAQEFSRSDPDRMLLLSSVMARGQGKTEGLHHRELMLPTPIRRRLSSPDTRDALSRRAGTYVMQASTMRSRVLYPALKILALGEEVMADQFQQRVDEVFFQSLFATSELEDEAALLHWEGLLYDVAWAELQRVIDRCSVPSERWFRLVSDAERWFAYSVPRHFPSFDAICRSKTESRGTSTLSSGEAP